uniref:tRNA (uracil-O(2)-)-methyltransferase n=1 Tax=Psilocybe cubensis TaxID=181762 RepID=A0A8H7XSI0_PSICU
MCAYQRPKFLPTICSLDSPIHALGEGWVPLITCPADFPIEIFEIAVTQLIHHPEYNSTLILRSELISESTSNFPENIPAFDDFQRTRCLHRKLLPRRPGRDPSLEQYCTLYGATTSQQTQDEIEFPQVLVLTPIVDAGSSLPYYHPAVFHLAFRYVHSPPTLRIEVLPLPGTPLDPNSRLYRTCLALLDTVHRYGWGAMTNYKKRVMHDCLIPREEYQDLYLSMRERYKHLVDTWQEVTDPLKHVFEDIGIATYLMLLWKDTFSEKSSESWPQPPGGFLDFGCGNGLLTHILVSEGYRGYGVDLRERTSWTHYPEATQSSLRVQAFNPTCEGPESSRYFPPGVFIIGNHADELTPWLPVTATLKNASGYISIPCCSWAFDSRYERSSTPPFPLQQPTDEFAASLNLGGDGSHKSSYSMYRIWLASLSLHCGWEVECETLRIPSTRNWALIGRRRIKTMENSESLGNAAAIVEGVISRGLFKTRKPEGKAGDH